MPGPIQQDDGRLAGASGRQWPLILAASGFNLLFEYSWRAADSILQAPMLLAALFIFNATGMRRLLQRPEHLMK
ncbi:MAG: hypothetical protein WCP36_01225 [Methanomicrobiales archaeon]